MKKIVALMGLLTLGMGNAAMAQEKGQSAVGLGINYATKTPHFGVGVKYQWQMSKKWQLEPNFNYYFKNDGLTAWDLGANVKYQFALGDKFKVYPLAGLGYRHGGLGGMLGALADAAGDLDHATDPDYDSESDSKSSSSDGKFYFNVGAGAQYDLNEKWAINLEARYQGITDASQAVIGVGVLYKF